MEATMFLCFIVRETVLSIKEMKTQRKATTPRALYSLIQSKWSRGKQVCSMTAIVARIIQLE